METNKTVEEVQEEVVVKVDPTPKGTTKMVHPDGKVAYVHESMIPAYKSGGFKEEK